MEVLRGVASLPCSSSSISQCSSSSSSSSSKSCPVTLPIVQIRPSGFVATLFGSLIASVPASLALNYDDFVSGRTEIVSPAASTIDFADNPALLFAGVAAAVAVPLIAFGVANTQSFGSASPQKAFAALAEEDVQMLDIRASLDARASGSPNLKSLRKRLVQVPYNSEDSSFVNKVLAKYRNAENTTLYILDDSDGSAVAVAKLLATSGFKKAFAITRGAEGWQTSELPWLEPRKGLNLNIDGLKNLLSTSDNPNLVPATVGAAVAAGIGVAIFTEAETVLQLLGAAAFIQIFARKFMFADDREKTIQDIQTFLDTKVAPKEFGSEFKDIGKPRGIAAAIEKEKDSVVQELKVADQA